MKKTIIVAAVFSLAVSGLASATTVAAPKKIDAKVTCSFNKKNGTEQFAKICKATKRMLRALVKYNCNVGNGKQPAQARRHFVDAVNKNLMPMLDKSAVAESTYNRAIFNEAKTNRSQKLKYQNTLADWLVNNYANALQGQTKDMSQADAQQACKDGESIISKVDYNSRGLKQLAQGTNPVHIYSTISFTNGRSPINVDYTFAPKGKGGAKRWLVTSFSVENLNILDQIKSQLQTLSGEDQLKQATEMLQQSLGNDNG